MEEKRANLDTDFSDFRQKVEEERTGGSGRFHRDDWDRNRHEGDRALKGQEPRGERREREDRFERFPDRETRKQEPQESFDSFVEKAKRDTREELKRFEEIEKYIKETRAALQRRETASEGNQRADWDSFEDADLDRKDYPKRAAEGRYKNGAQFSETKLRSERQEEGPDRKLSTWREKEFTRPDRSERFKETRTYDSSIRGVQFDSSERRPRTLENIPREPYNRPRRPDARPAYPVPRTMTGSQNITLGLEKITSLLSKMDNPQNSLKAVHVSGTNGKGSVCAYLTSSLVASGLKVGQFNSPHLIDRWDCITINNTVIPKQIFLDIEKSVQQTSKDNDIGASSFEILTACALQYFKQEKVDVAVIETGMGGLTDATNVFSAPLLSIITHISFDHTAYLGNKLEEIAAHKAGIIKPSCPVVTIQQLADADAVISQAAKEKNAALYVASGYWRTPHSQMRYMVENVRFQDADPLATPILGVVPGIAGAQQGNNVAAAVKALEVLRGTFPSITEEAVQKGIASASIPGRMEWVRFELPEGRVPMLLDGAHNVASCAALAKSVEGLRRQSPVVWVIAFSEGRDVDKCMAKYVKTGDSVACVEFGNVDGMEWVKPIDAAKIRYVANRLTGEDVKTFGKDVKEGIKWAVKQTKEQRGMLVGTGSLYLVGEIHRLLRDDPEFKNEEDEDEDDDML